MVVLRRLILRDSPAAWIRLADAPRRVYPMNDDFMGRKMGSWVGGLGA